MNKPNEIRRLMLEMDLTQVAVAKLLEVDDRTIRYWLSGTGRPVPIMAVYALKYLQASYRVRP